MMIPDDRAANPYEPPLASFEPVEETAEVYPLASRRRRLMAFLADYAILASTVLGLRECFEAFVGIPLSGPAYLRTRESLLLQGILTLAIPPLVVLYFACQESSRHQATLGKRLLGIHVVRLTGDELSFGRAVWRTIVKILGLYTLCVGWLISLFNRKRQALHDLAAGTVVVRGNVLAPTKDVALPDKL
jgi:uncharacterized RDD family membrane protein YckC